MYILLTYVFSDDEPYYKVRNRVRRTQPHYDAYYVISQIPCHDNSMSVTSY